MIIMHVNEEKHTKDIFRFIANAEMINPQRLAILSTKSRMVSCRKHFFS